MWLSWANFSGQRLWHRPGLCTHIRHRNNVRIMTRNPFVDLYHIVKLAGMMVPSMKLCDPVRIVRICHLNVWTWTHYNINVNHGLNNFPHVVLSGVFLRFNGTGKELSSYLLWSLRPTEWIVSDIINEVLKWEALHSRDNYIVWVHYDLEVYVVGPEIVQRSMPCRWMLSTYLSHLLVAPIFCVTIQNFIVRSARRGNTVKTKLKQSVEVIYGRRSSWELASRRYHNNCDKQLCRNTLQTPCGPAKRQAHHSVWFNGSGQGGSSRDGFSCSCELLCLTFMLGGAWSVTTSPFFY